MKVEFQGGLDGLCGMYALVNAFMLFGHTDGEKVLREACRALSQSRWPEVLTEGTTFGDMQRMAKRCKEKLHTKNMEIRYPFKKNVPGTNKQYWERFDEIFSDEDAVCAIIGIWEPAAHWIIAVHYDGHMLFVDSTAGRPVSRKRRSSLYAGKRKARPTQWLIDPQELIVFYQV
ncbi:hypothetical protein GCM10011491_34840 [Brucella endophytica]|uniref:Uncharacterized protein n=1 Tax=Brucella endophytica TaxID=1963359 RepID=A0A916WJM0_9HYPH|nr:hypothetical protein [Brucella endophytica]GGB03731.1 hypothetical protein GCM10011491_34840 [Brucella endophytica]